MQRSISFFGTEHDGIIYTYVNGVDANVQFANDKQTYASVVYDPGAVDVNLRQAAARAVKDFCGRAFQAKQISHTQGEGRDVWRFESEATSKGSISVTFGGFPSIEVELNKSKQVTMFRITPAKGSKMD